jgi:uncharacterized protein
MNKKYIIKKIEAEARKFFIGASGCHDWTHVERVRKLALRIGKYEKADLFVLELAALLHDIGRREEINARGVFCHALHGSEMARKILKKYKLSKEIEDNIVHCIKTHRYRYTGANRPETLEAKVLFDADKIDSLGAIGIGRIFLFAGNAGSKNLYTGNEKNIAKKGKDVSYTKEDSAPMEYERKLKFIYKQMLTATGKKLAKERHVFMEEYFDHFYKEIDGKL